MLTTMQMVIPAKMLLVMLMIMKAIMLATMQMIMLTIALEVMLMLTLMLIKIKNNGTQKLCQRYGSIDEVEKRMETQ